MARSADFLRTSVSQTHSHGRYGAQDDEYGVDVSAEPVGRSYEEEREWRGAGVFTLGAVAGALVGAGVALLLAPQSGVETREEIASRARRLRSHADDSWDDLRDELRRLRRRSRRVATRGRWKAEDLLDREL
jgi:hypothetical protein